MKKRWLIILGLFLLFIIPSSYSLICRTGDIWNNTYSYGDIYITTGVDTNATTECSTDEVLLGNGSCLASSNFYDDTDTTYTAGSNISITNEIISLNVPTLETYLDLIYLTSYENRSDLEILTLAASIDSNRSDAEIIALSTGRTKAEIDTDHYNKTITDYNITTGFAKQDECSEITGCIENAITSYDNRSDLEIETIAKSFNDNLTETDVNTYCNGSNRELANLYVSDGLSIGIDSRDAKLVVNGTTLYRNANIGALLRASTTFTSLAFEHQDLGGMALVRFFNDGLEFVVRSAAGNFVVGDRKVMVLSTGDVGFGLVNPASLNAREPVLHIKSDTSHLPGLVLESGHTSYLGAWELMLSAEGAPPSLSIRQGTNPIMVLHPNENIQIPGKVIIGDITCPAPYKLCLAGAMNVSNVMVNEKITIKGNANITGNLSYKTIYAQLSDLNDQVFAATGTKEPINLTTTDEMYGLTVSVSNVTIQRSGVYNIAAQPQVSTGAGGAGKFHMWLEKNVNDIWLNVSNSNVELVLASNEENVIPLITTIMLYEGEIIRLMGSVSDTAIKLDAQTPTGEPNIPSIIFTIFKLGN